MAGVGLRVWVLDVTGPRLRAQPLASLAKSALLRLGPHLRWGIRVKPPNPIPRDAVEQLALEELARGQLGEVAGHADGAACALDTLHELDLFSVSRLACVSGWKQQRCQ